MKALRLLTARWSPLLRNPWTPAQHEEWSRDQVGHHGENIAARWLQAQGCRILYRNYRADGGGEVDIVCRDQKVLVFCEVKTRTGTPMIRPGSAVTPEKQALIVRGASSWLQKLGMPDISWRYDIMEIVLTPGKAPEVNWLRTAFDTTAMKQSLGRRRRRSL